MKLRFFQNQEKHSICVDAKQYHYQDRWVNIGAPVLQYYVEEDGYWYDVESTSTSEEGRYDGERTMR